MHGLATGESFSTTATASPTSGGSSCVIGEFRDCWLCVVPSGGSCVSLGTASGVWLPRAAPSGGSSCVIGGAQLACLLTVSRTCHILDAMDFFNSSGSGWLSLYVTKESLDAYRCCCSSCAEVLHMPLFRLPGCLYKRVEKDT